MSSGASASRRRCARRMWRARSCSSIGPAIPSRCLMPSRAPSMAHVSLSRRSARRTETLPDWIGAHVNALSAIGGVPKAAVCDNLKAGITRPSRYEPGINRAYQDLADHYGFVVLPTRVRKPRDKAKVEVAVQIVERFVLAKLRKRRFFSLDELNAAIRECVAAINTKVMRAFGKSRRELLDAVERPALRGLPVEPYQYAEWKRCGVAPDYHVEIGDHYYSVPFRLLRETVDARLTDTTVEVFHKGLRVASHPRSSVHNRHTTTPEHMPSSHRRYATWTPQRMVNEAAKIGPATIALVEAIMKAKPHPEQSFRSCLGIMRLVRTYGIARVEAASRRGNDIGATTYGSIASILKTGLDRAYANSKAPDGRRSGTPTSVVAATTTDTTDTAQPAGKCKPRRHDAHASHPRPSGRARAHRHGKIPRGSAATARCRRPRIRGTPRAHGRPRDHRAGEQTARQSTEVRKPPTKRRRRGHQHESSARP